MPKPTSNLTDHTSLHIPEKLYFSIGEVAELTAIKAHVLRYWEQEFSALQPIKRRGNRRYYRRDDIVLVLKLKALLYKQGFTIEGAKAQLALAPTNATTQTLPLLEQLEQLLQLLQSNE